MPAETTRLGDQTGSRPPKATEPVTSSSICIPYAHFDKGLPEVWQIVMVRMPPSYAIDAALRHAGYSVPHGAYYPCEKGARPGGMFAYGTDAKGTPAGILVLMATFGNICDKEQISAALRPFVVRVRDVSSHDHDVSGTVLVDGMDCHENQWMIMLPVAVSLDALLPCEGTRDKIPAIAKASRSNFAEDVYEKYANLVRALRADPKLAKQVYFDVPYIPRPGFAYERGLLSSLGSIATFTSHLDLEARKALNWWALTKPLAKKPNVAVLLMTEFELLKIARLSKNDFARAVALRGLRLLPNRVLGHRSVKGPSQDGQPVHIVARPNASCLNALLSRQRRLACPQSMSTRAATVNAS
ncbi:hypothetical protein EV121DRAFT_294382 [Schizophyllum commune]